MKQHRLIIIVVIAFIAAAQLVMGLFLPSLPAIAATFSVSDAAIQQSFSIFIMIYGVSQLFYGVFSDYYGRKPLLLCGMLILLIGTLVAACATSLTGFLLAQFIEGLGAGSASVLARSIISDKFSGKNMGDAMSMTIFAASITPAITPFMGGMFQHYLGWRSIFIFLLIYVFALLILIYWKLPETLQRTETLAQEKMHAKLIFNDYVFLLKNPKFIFYVIVVAFGFSCQLLYLTISPFIFQTNLHINADLYGRLMMIPAMAYIVGNYASIQLNKFIHYSKVMFIGIVLSLVAGIALAIISAFHAESTTNVLLCITTVIFGYGFIASNAVVGAITPFRHIAGAASSLLGFLQMAGSSLCVAAVGFFSDGSCLALAGSFILVSLVMLASTLAISAKISHIPSFPKQIVPHVFHRKKAPPAKSYLA